MKVKAITKSVAKKLVNGTLPDIDTDFAGRDRAKIKAYMEDRFGKDQVASVGTFGTILMKGFIRDFGNIYSIEKDELRLMSKITEEGDTSMVDILKRAMVEPRLKRFLKENADILYEYPPIANQPKIPSIHSCAVIVFPDLLKAQEWCPLRKQKGLMVTEWGGYEMDAAGFLKDDILGIKQLDKFTDILRLIKERTGESINIHNIPLDDKEVYRYFSNGWNSDVFQLGTEGLTSYSRALEPQSIDDLIAAVAIYRPGPMQNHYHEIYVKCKNEGRESTYLWGTENITEHTYGLLIYQEQVMQVFQQLGGLSMKEADDVRRAMGKKKLSVLLPWKERVQAGFYERGANEEQFDEVWESVLEFAKYGFNKSHATAYAMTAYICMWLKVHYPVEYWTTALYYVKDKKLPNFLSEIFQTDVVSVSSPDINLSRSEMFFNEEEETIYWGISSIKGIGEDTADHIVEERDKNGAYLGLTDFIDRHNYKGSKVKKTAYEALISSGAFDNLYEISDNMEKRFELLTRYRGYKKVKIAKGKKDIYSLEQNPSLSNNWWWLLRQKAITGLALIDYNKIIRNMNVPGSILTPNEASIMQNRRLYRSFGGYVVEYKVKTGKKGKFANILLENNYKMHHIVLWNEAYETFKEKLKDCEKSFLIFNGSIQYEPKYVKGNQLTINADSYVQVLK